MSSKVQILIIALCILAMVACQVKADEDDAKLKAHFERIRQVVLCKYHFLNLQNVFFLRY